MCTCLTIGTILDLCKLFRGEFGLRCTHCSDGRERTRRRRLNNWNDPTLEMDLVHFMRTITCVTTQDSKY